MNRSINDIVITALTWIIYAVILITKAIWYIICIPRKLWLYQQDQLSRYKVKLSEKISKLNKISHFSINNQYKSYTDLKTQIDGIFKKSFIYSDEDIDAMFTLATGILHLKRRIIRITR